MKLRRRFSIRQLLAFTAVVGLVAAGAWYWRSVDTARQREQAIKELLAEVELESNPPPRSSRNLHESTRKIKAAAERVREQNAANEAAQRAAELLASGNVKYEWPSELALRALGPSALSHVLSSHDDVSVRNVAAKVLAQLGPQGREAVPALVDALQDSEEGIRIRAAAAIAEIDPSRGSVALPALLNALKSDDKLARTRAARALAKIDLKHFSHAESVLVALLDDPEARVRHDAAWSISKFGAAADSAVPALVAALEKHKGIAAVEALRDIGATTPRDEIVECFIKFLASDARPVPRMRAATGLGNMAAAVANPQRAVEALATALDDEEPDVRQGAASALGQFGRAAKPALPALTKALDDPRTVVRHVASEAIQKIEQSDP